MNKNSTNKRTTNNRSPKKRATNKNTSNKNTATPTKTPSKKSRRKINIKEPTRLTDKQNDFLKTALDPSTEVMFCSGPAGTSKTYLAIYSALQLLNSRTVNDLLYIRSAVESSDSKLGFLPGEEGMKLEPYLRPLRDKLMEFLSETEISFLYQEGVVDAEHVGYARGQDWKQKVIVIDEAQNLTYNELVTLTTRCGEYSKVFILGDPMQSDIKTKSGFKQFCELFDSPQAKENGIETFFFGKEDIVRSKLVRFIITELEKMEKE